MTAQVWTVDQLISGDAHTLAQAEAAARFDRNTSARDALAGYYAAKAAERDANGGPRGLGAPPPGDPATRTWSAEHLLDNTATRGAAAADARAGNSSARQALTDLRRITDGLRRAKAEHESSAT